MIKKRKLVIIAFLTFVFILFLLGVFLYFKPIVINDKFVSENKVKISLNRRFGKCYVNYTIDSKDLDDVIKDDLKKEGYKVKQGIYEKNIVSKKNCDTLNKEYLSSKNKLTLKGKDKITVESDTTYEDDGFNYSNENKVKKISDINTKILGEQKVIYKVKNEIFSNYVIRNVIVKDTIAPIIKLNGKSELILYVGNKYNEPGFVATDNHDGDITQNVIVDGTVDTSKEGNSTITYKVTDTSGNETVIQRKIIVKKQVQTQANQVSYSNKEATGLTYIKGILIVNKKYGLPKDYNPGVDPEANSALKRMQADASSIGLSLKLVSGYRSYNTQYNLYNNYVRQNGQAKADTFSARPGHSEHQTGLAFDVGSTKGAFANTYESKWLAENCHLYGFIIRYPKGKTNITGYIYEPWHIRYLGVETATKVKESGLTLEEYLRIN